MAENSSTDKPPVVVFAFKRADKLRRVLASLKTEGVTRLIIYVDGPRGKADLPGVLACRKLAREVNWTDTDLDFDEENHGLGGLVNIISKVFENYPAAIFLEDDCVPVQGFFNFINQALVRYAEEKLVFSIGGYQHLEKKYFQNYPYSLVSGARFIGWGWATWRDRWQEAWPYIENYCELFENLKYIPEVAGRDLPLAVRQMVAGATEDTWDLRVVMAALWLKKVHLLPVHGLIRNIGLDYSGMHGSLTNMLRATFLHNRNVARRAPKDITWLDDVAPNCEYVYALRDHVARLQTITLSRQFQRGRVLFHRYVWPRREVVRDLLSSGAQKPARRALLAYLTHPFFIPDDDPRYFNHVNIWHTHALVQTLNSMGYAVDVINYQDRRDPPRQDYDLFIGHGGLNFERISRMLPAETPRIFFATGSYWVYHNQQEEARFAELERRRGVRLPYDRHISSTEENALRLAHGILGLGNSITQQTYAVFKRVRMINGTALYDDHLDWCPKDFTVNRDHFLFFAGPGNVHKGLDLLLDAFAGLDEHLWISTRLDARFAHLYDRELNRRSNIHLLGWVQPRSQAFYQMMRRCTFCILPSCSEGQSQSVIEAMNQGLIPLVSQQTGLDVRDFGAFIEPVTVDSIRRIVHTAATYPVDRCQEMSVKARRAAQSDYSEAAFVRNLRNALEELLT